MTLEIRFELRDSDLERFRGLFQLAREKTARLGSGELLKTARSQIGRALDSDPPDFVWQRLHELNELVEMVQDEAWDLPAEDRERVLGALAYFAVTDDAIPDTVPVLGFLDDAIAAHLTLESLQHELDAYREFSKFRVAETQRRANAGLSTDISKEDWLTDQRAALHSRMRDHRVADTQGWHTITLFGFD